MVPFLEQRGDPEAGAGADDRGHALLRQRPVGPAQMAEMLVGKVATA